MNYSFNPQSCESNVDAIVVCALRSNVWVYACTSDESRSPAVKLTVERLSSAVRWEMIERLWRIFQSLIDCG